MGGDFDYELPQTVCSALKLLWLSMIMKLAGAAYRVWIGLRTIALARLPAPLPGSLSGSAIGGWIALRWSAPLAVDRIKLLF